MLLGVLRDSPITIMQEVSVESSSKASDHDKTVLDTFLTCVPVETLSDTVKGIYMPYFLV